MARGPLEGWERGPRRQPARGWLLKLTVLALPLAVVGELGHRLLGRLGQVLAHHLFHVLFGLGAALVFGAYVLVDLYRHGRPTFSWRLRPPLEQGGALPPP